MNKNCAFTICSKNYLAQAITLRESFLRNNPESDFYLFLADSVTDEVKNLDLVPLDKQWIPKWKEMAFKYDVIEFNTSIKPFAIEFLFKKGYLKVVYLDPDIYVFSNLDYVYDNLNNYSVILTPHRCFPTSVQGPVSEAIVSNVGVYNLGFIGIKNDAVGQKTVQWWEDKLFKQGYNDKAHGLFVDQKWMDLIPGFFPEDVLVSHHLGLNYARWNIQERKIFYDGDKAKVKDRITGETVNDLVFFHFSGYSPLKPELLDKRDFNITTKSHPELKPLLEEYRKEEMQNKYEYFSKMRYSFNVFDNGRPINILIRRAFRTHEKEWEHIEDPFKSDGYLYQLFSKAHLIAKEEETAYSIAASSTGKKKSKKIIGLLMRLLLRFIGVNMYLKLMVKAGNFNSPDMNSKYLL